ncbi:MULTISPECIES: response regulator [Pseudoalteromonas]|uniref:response regulator n=1 Tax=Pseudoalteromonas TaxID=53246 RepID=UPI00311DC521
MKNTNENMAEVIEFKTTPINKTKRLLLVDDDLLIEIVIRKMLNEENILIDFAASPIEALLMVSQNIYDIILMDIVMPQFTGTDVMLKIRKHADASTTKIIAHTFCESENSDKKYIKLGFDALLLKPVKQSVLIENIRYFLE